MQIAFYKPYNKPLINHTGKHCYCIYNVHFCGHFADLPLLSFLYLSLLPILFIHMLKEIRSLA